MLICLGGGYPIPGPGGVPCPMSGGVPHPMSGGYPIPGPGGVPHPRSRGGTPSHVRGKGVPSPEVGYPPGQTWDGVPPWPDLGWGTPPAYHPDLDGVPPQNVNRQAPVKTVPSCHTTSAGGKKRWTSVSLMVLNESEAEAENHRVDQ